jgi:hypothetical protein
MRRHGALAIVVLASVALASCGSNHAASGGSAAPAAPVPDPCTLLTRAALRTALHGAAPTGARTGTSCTYASGERGVEVRATAVATTTRHVLGDRLPHAQVVAGPGYRGFASAVGSVNGAPSTQAQANLLDGATVLTVVLTDPGADRTALVRTVSALARAAAGRL